MTTEELNEQTIDVKEESQDEKLADIAMQNPAMKKKFSEEVEKASREQTERALLAGKLIEHDNELLERKLKTFKTVSASKYDRLVKARDEVLSDIENCPIDKLQEVNKNLEIALTVEQNVNEYKESDRKRRAESVPLIDENGSSNLIRHREFQDSECFNLRDPKDDSCVEASLTWTKELHDFRKRKPNSERDILSQII